MQIDITIVDAVDSLAKDKYLYADSNGNITWKDNAGVVPTEAELTAEVTRLQAEYDTQEYARSRKAEYDALNQFELISDDEANGTTTHKDAIAAIKTKYPKV